MIEKKQARESIESLVNQLESNDDKVRTKARKLLVLRRNLAVPLLSLALANSKIYKVRWEAAKALGEIGDAHAIPVLVMALEDPESDVAWLAAKALEKFRKAAWPELLHALVKRGADSILLQRGAHHILRKQKYDEFNDLLEALRTALESVSVPESIPLAAFNILERIRTKQLLIHE